MASGEEAIDSPSTVAGRYALAGVLGRGSTADVRRARDLQSGDEVAVKIFRAECSASDRSRQRREVALLAQLNHPGLVGMRDVGSDEGRAFVVTDLVEGPTLAERIRGGGLDVPDVRRLGAQLADALAHVHRSGVVHRDVKPANVLLGDGSMARLADFGIAVAVDGTVATDTGCIVGTAAYLSPEQTRGEKVGPATDVWSLGLVLLEALSGRREYPGTIVEAATARLHRRPVVPDDLPPDMASLLRAMTDPDPVVRPPAAVVAKRLARPSGVSAHRRADTRARHRREPNRARRFFGLAASAMLTGATVGAALVVAQSEPVPTVAVLDVNADRGDLAPDQ